GLECGVTLAPGETTRMGLHVLPCDYRDVYSETDVVRREEAWRAWSERLLRVRVPGNRIAEETIEANLRDLASFPLLQGEPDEWLAPQAGMPLYPALFGRDALTTGWQ